MIIFPLCSALFLWAASRIFSRAPALALTDQGLYDRASLLCGGFVPWINIVGAGTRDIGGVQVGIVLRDEEAFLKSKWLPKRLALRFNQYSQKLHSAFQPSQFMLHQMKLPN